MGAKIHQLGPLRFLPGLLASVVMADSAEPALRLPDHSVLSKNAIPSAAWETVAKIKVGMTRDEVLKSNFRPKAGSMLAPCETYEAVEMFQDGRRVSVCFDFVFQPVSMKDSAFAAAVPHEGELRRQGRWPMPDSRDVVRAVGQPYSGPEEYNSSYDVSELSGFARRKLQGLKVGMTRRELLQDFEPTVEMMHPPTEVYSIRHAHMTNRYTFIDVKIDFKPAGMDAETYADPGRRAAWLRTHAWWPGENPDDTAADFYRPRWGQRREPLVDIGKLSEKDRQKVRILKIGATRKEVSQVFGHTSMYSPFACERCFLSAPQLGGPPSDPVRFVTVEIEFRPARFREYGRDWWKASGQNDRKQLREADDDVVTGFSLPYASSAGLAID